MKIARYFWDLNQAALRETRDALRNPDHPRFLERMAILLTRCDKPKEVFSLLPKKKFLEAWPRIRAYWLKRDRQSINRAWWETLYEQLIEKPKPSPVGKPAKPFAKVGKSLRERRIALGLNQTQLAKQTRLSQSVISQIEEGRKNMTLLTLLRLCKALKIRSLDLE
jgi:DNA-binding XRE family transcriptional regulator